MTIGGAFALTGVVIMLLGLMAALWAEGKGTWSIARWRGAAASWTLLATGAASIIAGAWWEALS